MTAPAGQGGPGRAQLDGMLGDGLLAGLSGEELAREFGTPLYVYDLDLVGRRVAALRSALPEGFRLAYAVKANPSLAVLAAIRATGIGADIASLGEFEAVTRAGFEPGQVTWTGPGKTDLELETAVRAGLGAVTVESPGELARLDRIAAAAGRRQAIMLRLAVSEDARFERVRLIGGAEGKFGMPLPVLREAACQAAASPNLELLGLHAFGASNLADADRIVRHVAELVDVAGEVAGEAGTPLRLVDAGGGLGIPYAESDPRLDLYRLGAGLSKLRTLWSASSNLARAEILFEPGRWIVGPAGALLLRVVDVKGTAEAPVAIVDGGINHAVRPALVRQQQRLVSLAADAGSRDRVPVMVAGPLCTGIDVLGRDAPMARPRPGDVLAMLDAGAYGFTESMPLFLSHPWAAEVAIRDGQARLVRPRLMPSEMLDRQILPDWD